MVNGYKRAKGMVATYIRSGKVRWGSSKEVIHREVRDLSIKIAPAKDSKTSLAILGASSVNMFCSVSLDQRSWSKGGAKKKGECCKEADVPGKGGK